MIPAAHGRALADVLGGGAEGEGGAEFVGVAGAGHNEVVLVGVALPLSMRR